MKKAVILFLLVSGSYAAEAQTVASSCLAPDSVVRCYRNDADRLAIRRVNARRSTYRDSVRINAELSSDYLNALIAVHNATILPANDTIIRLLNIHTYNPGLNTLVVMADSNLVWMTNLRYDILPTRDYEIDKLMRVYAMKKVFYSGLLQPSMVVFRTETNRNLEPLARKVKTFVGVKAAESEHLYGDGNDITDSITEKCIQLVYSYAWQECPTGCEQRRYWKFRVYSDCSVEYAGSYGNALEPALLLSEQENGSLFGDIRVYPNPVKNKLYVECPSARPGVSLKLSNKKGDVVYALNKLDNRQEIDLILLSNGVYYLTLRDSSKYKTFKIDKR